MTNIKFPLRSWLRQHHLPLEKGEELKLQFLKMIRDSFLFTPVSRRAVGKELREKAGRDF